MPQQHIIEILATEIRYRAGVGEDEPVLATRIAARLLGPNAVALDPSMAGAAYLRHAGDAYQIVVNPAASDVRFHVAHEIGEWALRSLAHFRGTEQQRERAANRLAAAILAPAKAVLKACSCGVPCSTFGEHIPRLAERFGISQTAVVLRLAEVRGDERAVVTRTGNVLVRSRGAFPWAEVPVVDIARGTRRWTGLSKARLRGGIDEGRVALMAG